jgi:hypothetical protein
VTHAWKRVRVQTSLDDVVVHDLRRTFGSIAGDAGFGDFEIAIVLNQRSRRSKVTSIYNRSKYDALKLEILTAVEHAVLECVNS